MLGVEPEIGRSFTEDEGRWGGFVDTDGGPRAIILTHAFWVRRFGADPGVVGRALPLNDEPVTVVGVLPATFDFSSIFTPTNAVDFLLPWPISDGTDSWGNTTTMVARLRPGVTLEAAQDELDAIGVGLQEADPNRWELAAVISGLRERIARPFRAGMLLLGAAGALVMLIVCVNLSNMLLARSPRRRREMAVRQTLGATRPRLVRQLLTEGVLVASSGAVVGVAIATAATRFVSTRSGLDIPMLSSISVDGIALLFTAAVAIVAGIAVSAVPALQVSEGREVESLGGSTRGGGSSTHAIATSTTTSPSRRRRAPRVALGTLVALVTTRLLGSLLYGVEPTDPTTFGMMIGLLLVVALLSGLIPAIRASRTDSASALRSAA